MDAETRALLSKRVTYEISNNLVRQLGGNMKADTPDAITEQNWVALSTMLIHLRGDMTTLIDMVLENDNGGLSYMAALTVIHDNILECGKAIEDALSVKTAWFPVSRVDRAKSGDKAGDYFYTKLRKEVEKYLDDKRKERKDGEN